VPNRELHDMISVDTPFPDMRADDHHDATASATPPDHRAELTP
jgi:hypothetical protein